MIGIILALLAVAYCVQIFFVLLDVGLSCYPNITTKKQLLWWAVPILPILDSLYFKFKELE